MATPPTYTINTIFLKPAGKMHRNYEEGRVGVGQTIYPGMLIDHDTVNTYKGDSELATYQPHGTAGRNSPAAVAIESFFTGQPDVANKGGTIDSPYAAGDLVHFLYAQSGDVLYMWLATGNNAQPNSLLSSNGDGTLRVNNTGAMFEAVDYLNNTSGSRQRLRVRKI